MEKSARLKRFEELYHQLRAAGDARPYDPDKYNRIVDELNTMIQTTPAVQKQNWILRAWRSLKK